MSKIKDEDIRFNIIINGDAGRKAIVDLEKVIKDASIKIEALIAQKKKLEQQGKTETPEYKKLTAEIERQGIAITKQRDKLTDLIRVQGIENMTLRELKRHLGLVNLGFSNAKTVAERKKFRSEIDLTTARIKELNGTASATGGAISRMTSGISKYFGAIMAGIAAMSFAIMGAKRARTAFLEYDEALVDAQKTTNTTKEEIKDISEELRKIDTRTSQNQLLDIVRIAGKLGIQGVKNIEDFVRAGDKISVALSRDLGGNAEQAIQQIGKLVDIFHLNEKFGIETSMLKVGSAINELGMASTASEGYIVEFSKRVAGVAPNADISIQSVLGLGAMLDKFGQTAETAGTAYGQVLAAMYKRTQTFADIAKMSLGGFRKLMGEDMNEAFIRVLEGMNATDGGMQSVVDTLDDMKLDGQRAQNVLGTLAKNTDALRQQQALANKAFEEGTSILDEFTKKNESAQAQVDKTTKEIATQIVILGEKLNPTFAAGASVIVLFLKTLTAIVSVLYNTRMVIIPLTIALMAYTTVVKLHAGWVTISTTATNLWRAAQWAYITVTRIATHTTNMLNAAMKVGPWGWAALAVSAVTAAITFFVMRTTEATKAQRLMNDINKEAGQITDEQGVGLVGKAEKMNRLMQIIEDTTKTEKQRTIAIKELQELMPDGINLINKETIASGAAAEAVKKHTSALVAQATVKAALQKKQELIDKAGQDKLTGEDEKPSFWQKLAIAPLKTQALGAGLFYENVVKQANKVKYQKELDEQVAELDKIIEKEQKKVDKNQLVIPKPGTGGTTEDLAAAAEEKRRKQAELDADKKDNKWSLDQDKAFLEEKLKLKERYQQGEVISEEQFNNEMRNLEIKTLEDRIASGKEMGQELLSLQNQLSDKRLEQKKAEQAKEDEVNKLLQSAEIDKVKQENLKYEQQKRQFAGNSKALEVIERTHQRMIAKIRLDEVDARMQREQEQYDLNKKILKNQHKQELVDFTGTAEERKRLRQEQQSEEEQLERDHLVKFGAQVKTLIDSGMFDDIQIDLSLLSEEEINKLKNQFEDIETKYLGLQDTIHNPEFKGEKIDLLGMSGNDWKDFLTNLENGKFGIEEIEKTTRVLISAFAVYDKFVTASENKQLKVYKKNNDKKKKELQKRLNSGSISQESYNAQCERIDAEYDAKKEEMEIKQAKRQKAMSITETIINTAVAIVSALKAGAIIGPILAAMIGAMGAAQIALIASTPISTGAEEGGYVVERQQDNKKFNARYSPEKRGYISSPTVLVAENGEEYVVPAGGVQNPTLAPILDTIEAARRKGTLGSFDFNAVYPHNTKIDGYATGGSLGSLPKFRNNTEPSFEESTYERLSEVINKLNNILKSPIPTYVTILGKNGLLAAMDEHNRTMSRGQLKGKK